MRPGGRGWLPAIPEASTHSEPRGGRAALCVEGVQPEGSGRAGLRGQRVPAGTDLCKHAKPIFDECAQQENTCQRPDMMLAESQDRVGKVVQVSKDSAKGRRRTVRVGHGVSNE